MHSRAEWVSFPDTGWRGGGRGECSQQPDDGGWGGEVEEERKEGEEGDVATKMNEWMKEE